MWSLTAVGCSPLTLSRGTYHVKRGVPTDANDIIVAHASVSGSHAKLVVAKAPWLEELKLSNRLIDSNVVPDPGATVSTAAIGSSNGLGMFETEAPAFPPTTTLTLFDDSRAGVRYE
jgi:hypothetical protein